MQETKTGRQIRIVQLIHIIWMACPVLNSLILAGAGITALYFILRNNSVLMSAVAHNFVMPYHRFMGKLCSVFPFSIAELLYVLSAISGLIFIAKSMIGIFRGGDRAIKTYRFAAAIIAAALCVYAAFCLLWGELYHSYDFETATGLKNTPVSVSQLVAVTKYFAENANNYGAQVQRDTSGQYSAKASDVLDMSQTIYFKTEQRYSFLSGEELRPKPIYFSNVMSYINFTGFFFPLTGEANINIHSPISLLPATAAHEIAHQRGIAAEDEANFVAVSACMDSGNFEFAYSGALLAYIHLSNALCGADYSSWNDIAATLSQGVRADLEYNNSYWQRYDTRAAAVTETVYTGFLQSHGEAQGMRSYGACVNLLVAKYYEAAQG